jgi:hypothetical protein
MRHKGRQSRRSALELSQIRKRDMCYINEGRLFCILDEKNNLVLGTHGTKNFFGA